MAVLAQLTLPSVSGFDLSGLDAYRWHPYHERVSLHKCAHTGLTSLSSCPLQRAGRVYCWLETREPAWPFRWLPGSCCSKLGCKCAPELCPCPSVLARALAHTQPCPTESGRQPRLVSAPKGACLAG